MKNIMNRIKELRVNLGISQVELAKKIETSQRNIGRWENESNEISMYNLIKLADIFNCSIDYLVGREDDFGIIQSSAPNSLTALESEMLSLFRALDTSAQHKAIGYVYALGH